MRKSIIGNKMAGSLEYPLGGLRRETMDGGRDLNVNGFLENFSSSDRADFGLKIFSKLIYFFSFLQMFDFLIF